MRWAFRENKIQKSNLVIFVPIHFYVTLGEEANFKVMEQRYL